MIEDVVWKEHRVSHSITSLQTHEQSLVMNIGNIIANLARYRKPAVADNDKARLLAATDNEIAEHVGSCQHSGIDAVRIVREYPPVIDVHREVLTIKADRLTLKLPFLCESCADFVIAETVNAKEVGMNQGIGFWRFPQGFYGLLWILNEVDMLIVLNEFCPEPLRKVEITEFGLIPPVRATY